MILFPESALNEEAGKLLLGRHLYLVIVICQSNLLFHGVAPDTNLAGYPAAEYPPNIFAGYPGSGLRVI